MTLHDAIRRPDQVLAYGGAMQDMSCLISEPTPNSPPRLLRSDVLQAKTLTDAKDKKTKTMPKNSKNSQQPPKEDKKEPEIANSTRSNPLKVHDCNMCDMSFTTNGGMLRHMKTHRIAADSDDSDSSDSKAKRSKKRQCDAAEDDDAKRKKSKGINNNNNSNLDNNNQARLKCTECSREDFASLNVLETHMEENHPECLIKCIECELAFKNYRALNLHRFMVHYPKNKSGTVGGDAVSGFNDCTFVDFSSDKFPEIAKTVCERSVHKSITEQKFRCGECSRDFPCESALEIHSKGCGDDDLKVESTDPDDADDETRRDDFFANLDLQNKSPKVAEKSPPRRCFVDSSKDLADIQSILSVAYTGGLLEQLPNKVNKTNTPPEHEHEEVQDAFAAEFRKMKLRGEFPCRLCTAIFPNLRALKGHNRVHLNGNGAGPYKCNMCPHSSLDKAALVRHMRTHNGDRPYECAVCNYAFTTKANCERHLRNRHSKLTRDDVKRSIIYHPSEDPNNDEANAKLNVLRDEVKRAQLYTPKPQQQQQQQQHIKTEPQLPLREAPPTLVAFPPLPRDLSIVIPQPKIVVAAPVEEQPPKIKVKGFGQLTQIPEYTESDPEHDDFTDEEIDPSDDTFPADKSYSGEIPMDLSTGECQEDVLDLSKKKTTDETPDTDSFSTSKPAVEFNNNNNSMAANFLEKTQQLLFARQQLLKNVPNMDPTANFYQLSQLYNRTGSGFPGLGIPPAFPLNPYFLPSNPFLAPTGPQNLVEMQKEIIRGLQLSGGGLVDHNSIINNFALAAKERFQAFQQHQQQPLNSMLSPDLKTTLIKTEDDVKPPQQLHVNTDTPTTIPPYAQALSSPVMMASPKSLKKETISSQSPNSVKMVIKNGVLMPKQKQRRYRTERPFSCEHCSARFTLRSNMERHIKQQHPQYWSQRQRSSLGNLPRKNPITLVPKGPVPMPQNSFDVRINSFMKNVHINDGGLSASHDIERKSTSPASPNSLTKSYNIISDQVKYAILAQQLKSQSALSQVNDIKNRMENIVNGDNEDEDEEDALVIDEEPTKNTESPVDDHAKAKRVAQEILMAAQNTQDLSKDFDWKITGNLISKNPQHLVTSADIPTFVTQLDNIKDARPCDFTATKGGRKAEEGDLVSVSKLLDNAATQDPFGKYFKDAKENSSHCEGSEEDEEGLVASSGSTSEGNNSGSDENRSESENAVQAPQKKKSAYSLAPNRVSCPYCHRKFPWSSSLRRHVLTHTGQKPYKCPHCPLLFTTKSNCDRHLLRKHGGSSQLTIHNTEITPNTTTSTTTNTTTVPTANSTPTTPATSEQSSGNQSFLMRNVPERPYKCSTCPSSTFSTRSNLRKHMAFKHDINVPESPKCKNGNNSSGGCSSGSEEPHSPRRESTSSDGEEPKSTETSNNWESQISKCVNDTTSSNGQNSDLPFKCHLCDGSFAERQGALDHMRECHENEYKLLMCKNALETGVPIGGEEFGARGEGQEDQASEENVDHIRGRFPDYANRKVVCAFCVRRFWSAEDLRRHMRTHTGERPYSCDVCSRRFTLKHSMLRHRKKHSSTENRSCEELSTASGDEDTGPTSPANATSTPISTKLLNAYQISIHAKNVTGSPEIPSNVNNNNSPPNNKSSAAAARYNNDDEEVESGGDLIGNLLGISDRGMINKLLSSPDEAAKLLGVNK